MRMPTQEECQELLDNTTKQWVSCSILGGDHSSHTVYGRLFTSKTDSSKTLFFPAAGRFMGYSGSFKDSGSYGEYWSSSVHKSNGNINGRGLFFYETVNCGLTSTDRYNGFSIRGVRNN